MGKPEIRFKGYTDEWEQRKLEECLSEITYGFTNPMSDTEEGPWKITAKDILDGMINYSSARHTSQIEYDDLTNKSKPLVGDLLLTKDGTLGRTAIVDAENVCINQSVALLRFNEKCSVQYAKTLLDTPMYQKQMLDDAGGGTIKHIYITKVDKMFISVPCMKEQERLVLFFNNLDNLITLHQRKCDEVKSLKKYMLQKIFPQNKQKVPEIRFEGFTEAWEQRKLDDVVEFLDTMRKPLEGAKRIPGPYPYYGASGIVDYVDGYLFDEELILLSEDGANITERNYPVCFLASGKYWVNNHAHVLRTKQANENNFICNSLERKDYTQYNTGMAMPKLNKETCKKIPILCPGFEEQKKVGDYFRSLDHLITLHQQKCEELKKIKKFMLQKMFV